MKRPTHEYVQVMRDAIARGGDLTEALIALRASGADMIDSIKVVIEVQGVSLRQAKWLVDESPAWDQGRKARQRDRDRVAEVFESHPDVEIASSKGRGGGTK